MAAAFSHVIFDLDGTLWDAMEPVYSAWAAALEQVTKERIMAAAQTVKPDTVYFLSGKEEA